MHLEPTSPRLEDIVSVEKINIELTIHKNENEKKYKTPPMHFMVYKKGKSKSNEDSEVYECACLEVGRFHIVHVNAKSKDDELISKIGKLISETVDIIAEHIRINIFEYKNDIIIEELKTDFMNDFWKIYRVYTMVQANLSSKSEMAKQIDQATKNLKKKLASSKNNVSQTSSKDMIKEMKKAA